MCVLGFACVSCCCSLFSVPENESASVVLLLLSSSMFVPSSSFPPVGSVPVLSSHQSSSRDRVARVLTASSSSDSRPSLMDRTTRSLARRTSSDPRKVRTALKVRSGIFLASSFSTIIFFVSLTRWEGASARSWDTWWAWSRAFRPTSFALRRASLRRFSTFRLASVLRSSAILADAFETSPSVSASRVWVNSRASRKLALVASARASPRFPSRTWVPAYPRAAPNSSGELTAAAAAPAMTVPTISALAVASSGPPVFDSAFSIRDVMSREMPSQSGSCSCCG
mmetsp:Transcript_20244/g.47594  ORF Transcript_20244/g.47594 Transcript_20244/m.47594 type:complete len:283 (+) Transcript_20244:117-965(+)